jgi:DNA replication protein DnaC
MTASEYVDKRREAMRAEHAALTESELIARYAPEGVNRSHWPTPWWSTLSDEQVVIIKAARWERYRAEIMRPPPDPDAPIPLMVKCACDGARWVSIGQGRAPVPCICLSAELDGNVRHHNYNSSGLRKHEPVPTFGDYEAELGQEGAGEAKSAAIKWSQGEPPGWVLLMGPPGVGKTHLLLAATHAAHSRRGGPTAYVPLGEFADTVRREAVRGSDTGDDYRVQWFEWLLTVSFLALDDIGREHVTDYVSERLHRLIDYRTARNLPTICSTNLNTDELLDTYDAPLVSRLKQGAVMVITGTDMRQQSTEGQPDEGRGHVWTSYAMPCIYDCGTGYGAQAVKQVCPKRGEDE